MTLTDVPFITNESLSDRAYSYILRHIITFDLKPGDPIIENDICTEIHISRTPVREAINRLAAEGFVVKTRNKGAHVRSYSQEDIIESCDVRILFECFTLQSAIQKAPDEEILQLKTRLENITPESPNEEYYQTDHMLHSVVTKYCNNTLIRNTLQSLSVQINALQEISGRTPHRLWHSRQEHLDIAEAMYRRDLERATERLKYHLENVKESSIQSYEQIRLFR